MSYTIYIKNQERAKSPIDKKQVENWVDELVNWLFDINQEYNNYRYSVIKTELFDTCNNDFPKLTCLYKNRSFQSCFFYKILN